jgi:hypothetical protein
MAPEQFYVVVTVGVEGVRSPQMAAALRPGATVILPIRDQWGNDHILHLSGRAITQAPPGTWLTDARGVVRIQLPSDRGFFEFDMVPSHRTLVEVLAEAVRHGHDNPSHGSNCSCMDHLIRELRVHVLCSLPEMSGRGPGDEWMSQQDHRQRVRHILSALQRGT